MGSSPAQVSGKAWLLSGTLLLTLLVGAVRMEASSHASLYVRATDSTWRTVELTPLELPGGGNYGLHVPEGDALRAVARDSASWAALWRIAVRDQSVPPPVDFGRDLVIVAAAATKEHTGHELWITSMKAAGEHAVVIVEERSPGRNCPGGDASTRPIAAVRAHKQDIRAVTFVERHVVSACTLR